MVRKWICWWVCVVVFYAYQLAEGAQDVRVVFPVDGLVLTSGYDGSGAKGLQMPLVGTAPRDAVVWINGRIAQRFEGRSDVSILMSHPDVSIRRSGQNFVINHPLGTRLVDLQVETIFYTALNVGDVPVLDLVVEAHREDEVMFQSTVCYVRGDPAKTYSITVDDASDVFAEVVSGAYASIFEHPTLAFFQRMHSDYGTVFSLFLFEHAAIYAPFTLAQMPDRFRTEFEANAHWLRLGFHARQVEPSRPYNTTLYTQAQDDLLRVKTQVDRFAGAASWDVFLRSHYWSGSLESCQSWRDAGIRGLYGALRGQFAYYLSVDQNRFLNATDAWRDNREDLTFVQTDIWLEKDATTPETLKGKLEDLMAHPVRAQNIQIFTHEPYLLPHSPSEMTTRLQEAIVYLTERGYVSRLDADDSGFHIQAPSPPVDVSARIETGDTVTLSWRHARRQPTVRYHIIRRELLTVDAAWHTVGETDALFWTDAAVSVPAVYRVFAVDAVGRQSGGSELIQILSRDLSARRKSDIDGDGRVDFSDFIAFAKRFSTHDLAADLNSDGQVDLNDLLVLQKYYLH